MKLDVAKKLLTHKLMTALTKQHSIKQIGSIKIIAVFIILLLLVVELVQIVIID